MSPQMCLPTFLQQATYPCTRYHTLTCTLSGIYPRTHNCTSSHTLPYIPTLPTLPTHTHTYTHTLTPQYEEPCSKGPGYKWYLFTVYAFSEHAASIMKGHGFSKTDTKPTKILELMNEEGYVLGQAQIIVYYSLYGDEETETTTTTVATPPAAGGGAPAVPGGAGAVAAPPGGGAPAPRIPAAGVAGGAVATAGGTGAAASAASVPPAV